MLENPRSPKVRRIAALQKKSERRETGLFLIEGPQALREALSFAAERVREVFATPIALEKHRDIASLLERSGIEPQFISEDVLAALSDTVTPQGFVAVGEQHAQSARKLFAAEPRLVVIMEEVRDPGNAGTIIRAADAVGADAVIFSGRSIDPFNPKVVRSTTGSLFHVPIAIVDELSTVIALTKAAGMNVLAADISGDDLRELRKSNALKHPTAWLFGNEARGLDEAAVALADRAIRVPIYGNAESLNLATAASVCLYETAFSQRG